MSAAVAEGELKVSQTPEGALFGVHVQPRASRCEICPPKDGELRLRLTSPPVDDAANRQCQELIAKALGVAKSKVSIKAGAKSRHKVVLVAGLESRAVASLLTQKKEE